jgi:hypothetical protein
MRLDLGPSLDAIKAELSIRIDTQAEVARLHFITAGAGQALEYQASEAEAERFLATDGPDIADFPFLRAELDAQEAATGVRPDEALVAEQIITQAARWRVAGAEIKRLRRAAKLAVAAASTVIEARAAAEISWPQPESP